ncbi:MAG: tetratricopeptide repeat protein [Sneathiellaceae bacterium]
MTGAADKGAPAPAAGSPAGALSRSTADLARLGAALLQANRLGEAIAVLEEAAGTSSDPYLWSNLGVARHRRGDRPGAVAALRRAVDLAPDNSDLFFNLGVSELASGCPERAVVSLRRAVARDPGHGRAWNSLGLTLSRLPDGREDYRRAEAFAAHRRALACDSGHADAWLNLGRLHRQANQLQMAETCYRQAAIAAPGLWEPHLSLAITRRDMGLVAWAAGELRHAAACAPDNRLVRLQEIFSLDFDPLQDTASQQRHRRAWARSSRVALLPAEARLRDPGPERPLRIGYISSDFNIHSAATTFAAAILQHDPGRFHVTCYDARNWDDGFNRRFRAAAASWRAVQDRTEAEIAEIVRQDRIDILVDLAGHTPGHRLGVFLRKPAPLQVTAWGHCTGTGMTQMDALLADPVLVPAQERALFAETVVDLPCALSYLPFGVPPAPAPPAGLAAWRGGGADGLPVTFGNLGRGAKLSRSSLTLWAGLLHAVPGSRLFLKDHHYRCRWRRRDIALHLAAQGIDPSRLTLAEGSDWQQHMQAYWHVDIALDTVPHGGGVTTLEALWMGVPVISLYGRFPSARIAAAILSACGQADRVARDAPGFTAIGQRLAAGVEALRAGRTAMRDALARTAPYDPPVYARAVEAAYRDLWRRHCVARG